MSQSTEGRKDKSRLAARRDGRWLDDPEARELWMAYSAHMEANRGDDAGFARARGFAAVRAEYEGGRAVLSLFTTSELAKAPPAASPGRSSRKRSRRGRARG